MKYFVLLWITLAVALPQGCTDPVPISIEEAVKKNDVEFVQQWLSEGGDPDYVDGRGRSLLSIATGPGGGDDVLDTLLGAGANPNLGENDYTPLMNAASWVAPTAVERLLEAGADPTLRNSRGQTALDTVGNAGGREQEVIRLLEAVMNESN